MKKVRFLIPLSILSVLTLSGCFNSSIPDSSGKTSDGGTPSEVVIIDTGDEPDVDVTGDFSISVTSGKSGSNPIVSGSTYTISSAGEYDLSGKLNGQVLINTGDNDKVVLNLNGVSITNSSGAPISILNADKVEISAKSGTANELIDGRGVKTSTSTDVEEGAIYAKCDLKLKGSGTLVVKGNYNNGIHCTKDLTIQKETLYVTATNNAIKGKHSITMESGNVTAVALNEDGLKTDDTDLSSSGKQRGTITISGGTLLVDSLGDGLNAAYNVVINESNDELVSTSITIKTGKHSKNASSYSKNNSAKGIKASNDISITAGTVAIKATDDALHANYGDTISSGGIGQGTINIAGGTIGIASGDDGIHADNTLTISGGIINITGASEGIESNHVYISGGETHIHGTDDGLNASKKINQTPTVNVSGGFLDVSVSTGDTDGIDSNGNFTQTGGFIVSRGGYGASGMMSTGLDVDGTATISGGTFIAFNGMEVTPTKGSGVLYAYYGTTGNQGGGGFQPPHRAALDSSYLFSAGTYTLSGDNFLKTFVNEFAYSAFLIYSSEMSVGNSYTLKNGSETIKSWTQSSSTTQIN